MTRIEQLLVWGGGVERASKAWIPYETCRFAATQPPAAYVSRKTGWLVTVRRSGHQVTSLAGTTPLTKHEAVAVCVALDVQQIDWRPFEALQAIRWGGAAPEGFSDHGIKPAPGDIGKLRAAALAVLGRL